MSKILFTGYYGFGNMGDDSFVDVCEWGSKNYWSNCNTSFLSPGGQLTAYSNVGFGERKFKGKYSLESIYYGVQNDYVVFGGGSLFCREIPKYSAYDNLRRVSDLKLTKLGGIGVSIGPFASIKEFNDSKKLLRSFSFLSVRDKESYNLAQELGIENITYAYDLAALLPEVYNVRFDNDRPKNQRKVIGVSLCLGDHYDEAMIKNRFEKFLFILKELKQSRNVFLRFFIINGNEKNGDLNITLKLIEKLHLHIIDYEILHYRNNIKEIWKKIEECDLVFSTRLHFGIFAAFSSTPFLQIEYHRKCTNLLDEIGYSNEFKIGDMEVSNVSLLKISNDLLDNPHSLILRNKEDCITRARLNFTQTIREL